MDFSLATFVSVSEDDVHLDCPFVAKQVFILEAIFTKLKENAWEESEDLFRTELSLKSLPDSL